jgi:hypothetical protein
MLGAAKQPMFLSQGDPYYNQVGFLFYFDGNLTDQKNNLTNVATSGTTVLSTATVKFGSGSINNGTGSINGTSFVNIPASTATTNLLLIGNQDFTFECWWWADAFRNQTRNYGMFQFNMSAILSLTYKQSPQRITIAQWNGSIFAESATLNANLSQWNHVCWSKSNGISFLGINGNIQRITNAGWTFPVNSIDRPRLFSDTYPNESAWGFFDSVRFTKGVGRYSIASTATTGTYIVPTTEFPNFG